MIDLSVGWARINEHCDFPEHKAILTAIYDMAGGPRMIDLGCGEAHVTKEFQGDYVDLLVRPTAPGKTMTFDMRETPRRLGRIPTHYNLLIMTDSLEHLEQGDGARLLEEMEAICRATVIFCPVGPHHVDHQSKNPDVHKSAWYPEQFYSAGWEIIEFPAFHRWDDGSTLGAFFAWQFRNFLTPPAEAVLQTAGIEL